MEVKDYIALYAALVATITGLWQILNGLRDRARLLVTARTDGNCFRIEATNVGRRPVGVKGSILRYQPRTGPAEGSGLRFWRHWPRVGRAKELFNREEITDPMIIRDGPTELPESHSVTMSISVGKELVRQQRGGDYLHQHVFAATPARAEAPGLMGTRSLRHWIEPTRVVGFGRSYGFGIPRTGEGLCEGSFGSSGLRLLPYGRRSTSEQLDDAGIVQSA